MQNQTFFYLRDQAKHPFGVLHLIYDPVSKETLIGASVCHENDEWNRERGRAIAETRANGDLAVCLKEGDTPTLEHFFEMSRFPVKDENGHAIKNENGFHVFMEGMPHRYKKLDPSMEKTFQTALRKIRPRVED